jgi:hypothetical protein
MFRDAKNTLGPDLGSSPSRSSETSLAPAPTQSLVMPKGSVVLFDPYSQEADQGGRATASTTTTGSVVLFDPYSQEMVVYTKPGGSVVIPSPSLAPASDPARGASMALRLVQLVLLSSVAVVIWYLLSML